MNKRQFIGMGILAVLLLAAVTLPAAEKSPLVGKPAPDFTLTTTDNKTAALSQQKGSVVLLDFWATWCPPCRASLPHINKLAENKELSAQGLVVWAVNARETVDQVNKFVRDNKYSFTVPLDANAEAMDAYGVKGIPTTVVVGRDGIITEVFVGFGGEESARRIDAAVRKALAAPK